jgi:hypothetical protein
MTLSSAVMQKALCLHRTPWGVSWSAILYYQSVRLCNKNSLSLPTESSELPCKPSDIPPQPSDLPPKPFDLLPEPFDLPRKPFNIFGLFPSLRWKHNLSNWQFSRVELILRLTGFFCLWLAHFFNRCCYGHLPPIPSFWRFCNFFSPWSRVFLFIVRV